MKYTSIEKICPDFSITKYQKLCLALLRYGYATSTVASYLETPEQEKNIMVIRHDVDRKPRHALLMAQVEHKFGIKSTYYFRFNRKVFRPGIIREIAELEHEIGYHYETLDKAMGDHKAAVDIFKQELDEFKKVADIKTICMHGNPLTNWDNRDLWSRYDFHDFGLIGEAYLSFKDMTYLSDTGRTWGNKYKIKDKIYPADCDAIHNNGRKNTYKSTDDIIKLIETKQLSYGYLLVHPERWSNSLNSWVISLATDTGVNLVKRLIQFRNRPVRQLTITKENNS